tara:strand:+ start:39888 stop:40028 length:141 start_codon:yes stop_codon:yes gene_type:complete
MTLLGKLYIKDQLFKKKVNGINKIKGHLYLIIQYKKNKIFEIIMKG